MFRYTLPLAAVLYLLIYGLPIFDASDLTHGKVLSGLLILMGLAVGVYEYLGRRPFKRSMFYKMATGGTAKFVFLMSLLMTLITVPLFFIGGPDFLMGKFLAFLMLGVSLPLLGYSLYLIDPNFQVKTEESDATLVVKKKDFDLDDYSPALIKLILRHGAERAPIKTIMEHLQEEPKRRDLLKMTLYVVCVERTNPYQKDLRPTAPQRIMVDSYDFTPWLMKTYGDSNKLPLNVQGGQAELNFPDEFLEFVTSVLENNGADRGMVRLKILWELRDPAGQYSEYPLLGSSYHEVCRTARAMHKEIRREHINVILSARQKRKELRASSNEKVSEAQRLLEDLRIQSVEPLAKLLEVLKRSFNITEGDDDFAKLEIPTLVNRLDGIIFQKLKEGFLIACAARTWGEQVAYRFTANDHIPTGYSVEVVFDILEKYQPSKKKSLYNFYEGNPKEQLIESQLKLLAALTIDRFTSNHESVLLQTNLLTLTSNQFLSAITAVGKHVNGYNTPQLYAPNLLTELMVRYDITIADLIAANLEGLFDFRAREKGYPVECWININGVAFLLATTTLFYKGENVHAYEHLPFVVFSFYYLKLNNLIVNIVRRKTDQKDLGPTVTTDVRGLYNVPADERGATNEEEYKPASVLIQEHLHKHPGAFNSTTTY